MFYSLPPTGNKIPLSAIVRTMKSTWRNCGGTSIESIKSYLGAKHVLYLSSGRAALWLILEAVSRINPERREVILPAYTCPAVASAILKADLKPILCDNNLTDFGFSIKDLLQTINKNTLAVIVAHLFGYPANIQQVKECCRQHDVWVVEDAAQGFGNSLLNSRRDKLGLLGDCGFFSFGRGKPISILHGGVLTTNSDEIFQEATKVHKNFNHHLKFQDLKYGLMLSSYEIFSNPYLYWIPQRIPFLHLGETIFEPDFIVSQGNDLAAFIMLEVAKDIEEEKGIRKENSQWYSDHFCSIPLIRKLENPDFPYLRYPLIIEGRNFRDRILNRLMRRGAGAAVFYPTPLNELPGLKEVLRDTSVYPNSKNIAETLITLPVHSGVQPYHRQKVLNIIREELSR